MKRSGRHDFFEDFHRFWPSLLEMLFVVLLASLGVNLVSSIFVASSGALNSAILGGLVILSSLVMFVYVRIRRRSHELAVTSFFLVNKDGSPVSGGNYYFSDRFEMISSAVFAENPRFRDQWNEGLPISYFGNKEGKDSAVRIAREISEFIAIDHLSVHLVDHFNESNIAKENIREFSREDLSDVVLKNRVLELISRDMEDREGFESREGLVEGEGVVSAAYGPRMYSRLDMWLPRNSRIERGGNGELVMKTPYAKVSISTTVEGFSVSLPVAFVEQVLGMPYLEVAPLQVNFVVRTEVNALYLLLARNKEYYTWIDSYLRKFSEEFDEEDYFESINWRSVEVLLLAWRRAKKASRVPGKE